MSSIQPIKTRHMVMTPDSTCRANPTILTWHVSIPKAMEKKRKKMAEFLVPKDLLEWSISRNPQMAAKCWGSSVVKSVVGPRSEVTMECSNSECLGKCGFRRVEHDMLEHDILQEVHDPWNFRIAEWVGRKFFINCLLFLGCWLRGGGFFPKPIL